MATSRDVARRAGVSQATVSRVLNSTGPISPDTRRRVMDAVEELGYVKHAGAAAMRTRRTRTVGVVVSEMSNPFFQEIFDELTFQFATAGLRTMVWHAGTQAEDAVAAIRDRAIDGIVFSAHSEESPEMQAAVESGRPLLLLNRVTSEIRYDCVVSDNRAGGELVADYLVRSGRTHAVHIAGDQTTSTGRGRREGFLTAMDRHGFPVPVRRQLDGGFSAQRAASATREYLAEHGIPEAFFCANDAMAIATLNTLAQAGISVPEDTWVIGYDDVAAAGWPLLSLTTVAQSSQEMARTGAELLLRRMEDPEAPWEQRVFEPTLQVRGSTAHQS